MSLKVVAKAWSFGLLFFCYLYREGIVMGHILVVSVPSVESLPIDIMAMERVVEYMLKVQKSPSHRLSTIA